MQIKITSASNGWVYKDDRGVLATQMVMVFTDKMKLLERVATTLQVELPKPAESWPNRATSDDAMQPQAQQAKGWNAVCDELRKHRPGFLSEPGSGIECAIRAIRQLAAQADGQSSEQAGGEQVVVHEVSDGHLTEEEARALVFICRWPTTIARIMAATDGPSQEDMASALKKTGAAVAQTLANAGITV